MGTPKAYTVIPARAMNRPLVYLSADEAIKAGAWVTVPLGSAKSYALVLDRADELSGVKLKTIESLLPLPPASLRFIAFLQHMANYTLADLGLIVKAVLTGAARAMTLKNTVWLSLGDKHPAKLTQARQKVLDAFQHKSEWRLQALTQAAGVSSGVITSLVKEGIINRTERPPAPLPLPNHNHAPVTLNADQQKAAKTLSDRLNQGFSVTLLEGVTGSGKTEVYFTLIAGLLEKSNNGQVLVMMPEIALTESFIKRFELRFGCKPGVWHSSLSDTARGRLYRDIIYGEARIVLGARSALFLPFRSLELTIIDEEHDSAYKSEERIIHHARDMAILRAKHEQTPVVLCSATPSLETWVNLKHQRYYHVRLGQRFLANSLPSIQLIDLRHHTLPTGRWISEALAKAVQETLDKGSQALLFLNRRGYAPMTLCRSCGFRFGCPTCTSWLVEHRNRGRLCCHHCGYSRLKPDVCPECHEPELIAYGPGVERIGEEAQHLFPKARILVLSSDSKGDLARLNADFEAITKGDVNLVIGTQLIAKGHHFPQLGMVGVIDGDLGLAQADLRASERSYQLLTQVVGRAGREKHEGRGFIQTLMPDHPVLKAFASGDQNGFYTEEAEQRARFGWPPLGRLAALIVSSSNQDCAAKEAHRLVRFYPSGTNTLLLGPVEAPIFRIRNIYRYRLLLKTDRATHHAAFVKAWLDQAGKSPPGVRIQIDIDPISFM